MQKRCSSAFIINRNFLERVGLKGREWNKSGKHYFTCVWQLSGFPYVYCSSVTSRGQTWSTHLLLETFSFDSFSFFLAALLSSGIAFCCFDPVVSTSEKCKYFQIKGSHGICVWKLYPRIGYWKCRPVLKEQSMYSIACLFLISCNFKKENNHSQLCSLLIQTIIFWIMPSYKSSQKVSAC